MAIFIPGFRGLRERTQFVILALFACLGILYLATKVLPIIDVGPHDHFDFRMFWLAGKVWASGQNPYETASYPNEYYETFNQSRATIWFYPPYWYPLIVPFGLLSFQVALSIWKIINFLLLIGATHLIARALADVTRQRYMAIFLPGIGYACLMEATAVAIWSGQSSILVYFGLAAMIFGILKSRPLLLIVGLVFLALKPQIGVVAFAAVAAHYHYRWTVLPAAATCLLASVPIAITGDYRASVEGFLTNLTHHAQIVANTPPNMTGLIHISDYLFSISNVPLSSLIGSLMAIICAIVVFYNSSLNKAPEIEHRQHQVASLALFVASTFFFTPLHYYDLVVLAALLMMIVVIPFAGRWLIAFGLLMCFRPGIFFRAFGITNSDIFLILENRLASAGLFLLFVGAMWAILTRIPLSKSENMMKHS
jgi:hypothetical protein